MRKKCDCNLKCDKTGGKGKKSTNIQEDDSIAAFCVTHTHRDVFFFTNMGRQFSIKGYEIPETKTGKGKPDHDKRHVLLLTRIERAALPAVGIAGKRGDDDERVIHEGAAAQRIDECADGAVGFL